MLGRRSVWSGCRGLGRNRGRGGHGGQHGKKISCFHTKSEKPASSFGCAEGQDFCVLDLADATLTRVNSGAS
jgi:hypothetical protein